MLYYNIKPIERESILPWESDFTIDTYEGHSPKISIVIPIFNSGAFLEKTLRSLLCNDLDNIELILIDGGSSDNTMQIVEHYKEIFDYVESKRDKGQSDAINKGYKQATGDIYYWLNGDDIILPNVLNKIKKFYVDNLNSDVVVGNAYMTEVDFKPIRHFVFSEEKLHFDYLIDYASNHLIQPSVFFTRKAWEKVGPLNVDDHYAMDADLFIGMSKYFKIYHLDVDIAYSVYHEGCKTRKARAESISSLALIQAKYSGFNEARKTLDILVELYHQLEDDMKEGNKEQVMVLKAKLDQCEERLELKKTDLLRQDILEHS